MGNDDIFHLERIIIKRICPPIFVAFGKLEDAVNYIILEHLDI